MALSVSLRDLFYWGLAVSFVLLSGCQGCVPWNKDSLTEEELEKRRRQQQDALVANDLVALPTDSQRAIVTAKPGHWVETSQRFKSTREDLQVMAVGSVYRGSDKIQLPTTNFQNEFTRRSVLPMGQEKTLGLQFFVPVSRKIVDEFSLDSGPRGRLAFNTELFTAPLMAPVAGSAKRSAVMELQDNEFQLAVISPQALAYQYLSSLDTVLWPISEQQFVDSYVRSYEVSLVEPKEGYYALPHSFLTMTAMAVIVWDDVDCSALTIDQQRAIIDWVHWGGQLIISGPGSWSRLIDSFLVPYLPVVRADSVELETDDFAELSATWRTRDLGKLKHFDPIEIVGSPLAGLKWQLSDRGSWLPGSGELVAESSVGRGRIVMTGFSLREPRVTNWPYYSSFFSTGLLRRWPRSFQKDDSSNELRMVWAAPFESDNFDPRMHSNLRILSRDLPKSARLISAFNAEGQKISIPPQELQPMSSRDASPEVDLDVEAFAKVNAEGDAYEPKGWAGAAAWSDYQGLSDQAVDALRAAAGIELPSRSTIVRLLAGYLLCLIPLNYLAFRLLGRLELAWVVAPILALVGVVVVTKVAQLDIGFARRTTDIGILELHEGHPRGHLTQYIALYTSLSTNYSIEFPEFDSVALPMVDLRRDQRRGQSASRVLRTNYGRAEGVVLEPLTVYSNSTEMIHAEQMVELSLPIQWLRSEENGCDLLVNSRDFALDSVLLLQRTESNEIRSAWLDRLEPGQRTEVQWQDSILQTASEPWNGQLHTQLTKPETNELKQMRGMWLGGILDRLLRKIPLPPGTTVLMGLTDHRLGTLNISPAQDQYDSSCIVVAHLTRPNVGSVKPDLNILSRSVSRDSADDDAGRDDRLLLGDPDS